MKNIDEDLSKKLLKMEDRLSNQSKMSDEALIAYSKNLRNSVSNLIKAIHVENTTLRDNHE